MADIERQLHEDRALRDAARRLVTADIGFIRSDIENRSIASRVSERAGEGAREAADGAAIYAEDNPGKVGSGLILALLALLAFLFRDTLFDLIDEWLPGAEEDDPANTAPPEQDGRRARSETN